MFRLMPALVTIDIGANPLHVLFHGTVLGKLTTATAGNFRQASVVHCHELFGKRIDLTAMTGIESIRSWVSMGHKVEIGINLFAPKLEAMHVMVHRPPSARPLRTPYKMFLTPYLVDIDIMLNAPGTALRLHGLPHHDIRCLRVVYSRLEIETSLWDFLNVVFNPQLPPAYMTTTIFVGHQPFCYALVKSDQHLESKVLDC